MSTTSTTSSLYAVAPGAPAYAADLNQYDGALTGTLDLPALTLYQPLAAPGAPTATVSGSGSLVGAYQYAVAYVTGGVDGTGTPHPSGHTTALGTASASVTPNNQSVVLTAIPVGPTGVIARDLYRTKANAPGTFYYLGQLADNTSTTWTDDLADSGLGAEAPSINTTGTPVRLPVYPTVPAFTSPAGTVAVVGATGSVSLYQSTGSAWEPVAAVASASSAGTVETAVAATGTPQAVVANPASGATQAIAGSLYVANLGSGLSPGTSPGTAVGIGDMPGALLKANGFTLGLNGGGGVSVLGAQLLIGGAQGGAAPNYGGWTALNATGTNALQLAPDGSVTTQHNTLDNGSGLSTFAGLATFSAGITGSGTTGALTAGSGLLDTPNTFSVPQTLSNTTGNGGVQATVSSNGADAAIALSNSASSGATYWLDSAGGNSALGAGYVGIWYSAGSQWLWRANPTSFETNVPATLLQGVTVSGSALFESTVELAGNSVNLTLNDTGGTNSFAQVVLANSAQRWTLITSEAYDGNELFLQSQPTSGANTTILTLSPNGDIGTAGALTVGGAVAQVAGETTTGTYGVLTTLAWTQNAAITTTSGQQLWSFTPPAGGLYTVKWYLRVTATTTVTATVAYADSGGAQTYTPPALNAQALAANSYSLVDYSFEAVAGTPITLTVTASTTGTVYATTALVGVS